MISMNILLATDGSDGSAAAERLLAGLPLPPHARVTVLSAVSEHTWLMPSPIAENVPAFPWLTELYQAEQAAARWNAEETANLLRSRGPSVVTCVTCQNPAMAILDHAEVDGTDLIVVGSHGKGTVERLLAGSVSERVARYAHCSVLVARGTTLQRVLVAVDSSEASDHALAALARLPLPADAELTVVHVMRTNGLSTPFPVVPGVNMDAVLASYDREHRDAGERIARRAQERLKTAGYTAAIEVRRGFPAAELVSAAEEAGADLIVVGAANRSPVGRLFLGGVSGRVLCHAPCSVLVARGGPVPQRGIRQKSETARTLAVPSPVT